MSQGRQQQTTAALPQLARDLDASAAPKYRALRDMLVRAISRGRWKPGERLPTEIEMASQLPLSLGTVQRAYGMLVEEGLVVRKRGRGSFVSSTLGQMPEPWHCRFLDSDGSVLPVYPRYLGRRKLIADSPWHELLRTNGPVMRIDRLLSINGEFDVLSRFYASATVAAPLMRLTKKQIESANFKEIILRELHMPITHIGQTVRLPDDGKLGEATGRLSKIKLVVEAIAYTRGAIAYYQELFVSDNKRRLVFESNFRDRS